MAGTNDLGSFDHKIIEQNIIQLHTKVLNRKIRSLALGIPESSFSNQFEQIRKKIDAINVSLRNYADREDLMHFLDNPVKFNEDCFAPDGLHFTKDGYQLLGNCVGAAIENIFNN